ncbi:hypothetical protein [Campylobacter coli]|uniref:hypothetical protein n=2 Tax=Campylobacter coli TaxID=195 RepID=UPI0011A598D4|nr:hypothetical protein [Campylobacter coli]
MKKLTLTAYFIIFLSGLWFLFSAIKEHFGILSFILGIALIYFGVTNIKRILNDSNENKTELETLFATANIIFALFGSVMLLVFIIFFTFQNEINIKFFSDQGLVLKDDKKISIYFKEKEIKSFDENKYGFVMAVYGTKHIEVVLQNKENDTFFELRCNEEGCKEILKEDK